MDVPNRGLKLIQDQVENLDHKNNRVKGKKDLCKMPDLEVHNIWFITRAMQEHNRLKNQS